MVLLQCSRSRRSPCSTAMSSHRGGDGASGGANHGLVELLRPLLRPAWSRQPLATPDRRQCLNTHFYVQRYPGRWRLVVSFAQVNCRWNASDRRPASRRPADRQPILRHGTATSAGAEVIVAPGAVTRARARFARFAGPILESDPGLLVKHFAALSGLLLHPAAPKAVIDPNRDRCVTTCLLATNSPETPGCQRVGQQASKAGSTVRVTQPNAKVSGTVSVKSASSRLLGLSAV